MQRIEFVRTIFNSASLLISLRKGPVNMRYPLLLAGVLLFGQFGCSGHNVTVTQQGPGSGAVTDTITGTGDVQSESRQVSGFNAIQIDAAAKVRITQSGKESLDVRADKNLLQYLTTTVENGTLKIGVSPNITIKNTDAEEFTINVKSLSTIKVAGAAKVDVAKLDTKAITISVAGAAEINLDGKADTLTLTLDGVGNVDAEKLKAQTATVSNSGVGRVVVDASDSLNASISGVGSVEYFGSPKIQQSISGLGKLTHRE